MDSKIVEPAVCDALTQLLHERVDVVKHPVGCYMYTRNSLAFLDDSQIEVDTCGDRMERKQTKRHVAVAKIETECHRTPPKKRARNKGGISATPAHSTQGKTINKVTKLDEFINSLIHQTSCAVSTGHSVHAEKKINPIKKKQNNVKTNKISTTIKLSCEPDGNRTAYGGASFTDDNNQEDDNIQEDDNNKEDGYNQIFYECKDNDQPHPNDGDDIAQDQIHAGINHDHTDHDGDDDDDDDDDDDGDDDDDDDHGDDDHGDDDGDGDDEICRNIMKRMTAANKKCRDLVSLSCLLSDEHNYTASLSYTIAEIVQCMSSDRRGFVERLVSKCVDFNLDTDACRSVFHNLFLSTDFTCNGWLNNSDRPVCVQREIYTGKLGMGLLPSVFFKTDLIENAVNMVDYVHRCRRFTQVYKGKHKLCFMCAALVNMNNTHVCNVYLSDKQTNTRENILRQHGTFDLELNGLPSLHTVKIMDAPENLMVTSRFVFPDRGDTQFTFDYSNLNFATICSSFVPVDSDDAIGWYTFEYHPTTESVNK